MEKIFSSVRWLFAMMLLVGLGSCKERPSMVEQRKAEIRKADSLELVQARKDLVLADSMVTFKAFELESLKKLFVFEKEELYQTTGYYVLPAYQGSKARFSFFPEVEEGGKLLLVSIDKKRQYTFAEVNLEDESPSLPSSLSDAQRQDVAKCRELAQTMSDLADAKKQKEKLELKVEFYERKLQKD